MCNLASQELFRPASTMSLDSVSFFTVLSGVKFCQYCCSHLCSECVRKNRTKYDIQREYDG